MGPPGTMRVMSEFTHLHVHSEYSLLDGLARVDPLVRAAGKEGMNALALTDHGVMFGAMEFYKTAHDHGVKPIIGIETYVAPRAMHLREGKQDAGGYHLVLLAENETGYRNLLKLASEAQLHGFYYKPRIDRDLLAQHADGLVCLSACLSSEMGRALTRRDIEEAERVARWHAELFPGRYYLEIQDHGLDDQKLMTQGIVEISRKLGLPLVATNDVHYIARENSYAHEVLLCVQTGVTMDDPKRMRMDSPEFYLKSPAEMAQRFAEFPEAIRNTMAIAERCNLKLDFSRVQLPAVAVPAGHTVESWLAELCNQRLAGRYEEITDAMRERLAYELSVINATGFAAYFLLLEDLVSFARKKGIGVGPGRGSAAGSLVAYVLTITDVDPLAHGLIFERFLNPERKSMPDIDTDFADDRRDEVIKYIVERYGADHVAQISTFGSMAARAAIKDVGRALGMPYGDVEAVAKLIPQKPGQKFSIKGCLEQRPRAQGDVRRPRGRGQVAGYRSATGGCQAPCLHPCRGSDHLRGSPGQSCAAHPARKDEEGIPATQYEYRIVDRIGLLKMDILGLTTLTVIRRALDMVEATRGHVIDPREIDLEDPAIYEILCTGETTGLFQLESGGMKKLLKDMQPSRFADIVALIALYRPGPMNFIDDYIGRKSGKDVVTYPHPSVEPILKDTYGIIVYQDQVLQIARELAGFSWGQADVLRKAMGKKLPEEMKKQKEVFEEGCKSRGTPLKVARDIWPVIEVFAGYGFAKCLDARTELHLPDGSRMPISRAYHECPSKIMAIWPDGLIRPHRVQHIVKTGHKALLQVTTQSGKIIRATPEHRLLTTVGYRRIDEMHPGMALITASHSGMALPGQSDLLHRPAPLPAWLYQAEQPANATYPSQLLQQHALPRHDLAARHERTKWLVAHDAVGLVSIPTCDRSDPGYSGYSLASNGTWCASHPERDMCEWLIAQGIDFEMHRVLPNGHVSDFYFNGLYWDMDAMDRLPSYVAEKYGDLPYVVVTPEDFKFVVEHHLALQHDHFGDLIVSIAPCGIGQTYDIEMAADGPLNFLANDVVSHNSHAAAYAVLSAQTAYIKQRYTPEYMAACLSMEQGNPDRTAVILAECRRLGVNILPPDVNRSVLDYSVDDGAVRYGLSSVRNVGATAVRGLLIDREQSGSFATIADFCGRVDWKSLNKRAVESLIKSGAMDALGDRATLLSNLDRLVSHGQRSRRAAELGQVSLFAVAEVDEPALTLIPGPEVPRKQLLRWEKEMLGLYLSEHPLAALGDAAVKLGAVPLSALVAPPESETSPAERRGRPDGDSSAPDRKVKVVAMVSSMRQIFTRKNETMLSLELEDLEGRIEAVVFPRTYERTKAVWAEDAILLIDGSVDVRDDRIQLICENATLFEAKFSDGTSHLVINFRRSADLDDDLRRLKGLYYAVQEFEGTDTVEFTVEINGRQQSIPMPSSRVTTCCCPQLLDRLAQSIDRSCLEVRPRVTVLPTVVAQDGPSVENNRVLATVGR